MGKSAPRVRRYLSLAVLTSVFLVATCLGSACHSQVEDLCVKGATEACSCPGGTSGVQTCDSNNSFGSCVCAEVDAASEAHGGDAAEDSHAGQPFMAACSEAGTPGDCDPEGCAPNCTIGGYAHLDYCYDYKSRGLYCTHACTTSSQCPPPSGGCNAMGICRAPGATGAGGDGGGGHDGGGGGNDG